MLVITNKHYKNKINRTLGVIRMALLKKRKSEPKQSKDNKSTQQSARSDDSTGKSQQDEAKALLEAAQLKEDAGQCAFC